MDFGPILADEFCGHRQFLITQISIRGQRGVLLLWQGQFKRVEGLVRDGLECCARDPGLADERGADKVDLYSVALEDHRERRKGFSTVRYEDCGAFYRYRYQGCVDDRVTDVRFRGAVRRVQFELGIRARLLQRGQSRWQSLRQFDFDPRDIGLGSELADPGRSVGRLAHRRREAPPGRPAG